MVLLKILNITKKGAHMLTPEITFDIITYTGLAMLGIGFLCFFMKWLSDGWGHPGTPPLLFSCVFATIFFASCHPKNLYGDEIEENTANADASVAVVEKQNTDLYYIKSKQYDLCKNDILNTLYNPDSYINPNLPKSRSFVKINDDNNHWKVIVHYYAKNKAKQTIYSKAICVVNDGYNEIIEHKIINTS